jgi:hypothetical protein
MSFFRSLLVNDMSCRSPIIIIIIIITHFTCYVRTHKLLKRRDLWTKNLIKILEILVEPDI